MNGQKYYISDPVAVTDLNVPTEGTPVDIVAITASAAVPIYLEYLQINCGVNAAQIQKATLVMRSTSGSGGSALGIRNASPAGPGASMSANFLVTTLGALSGTPVYCEDWQQFGGLEIDRRDDPILIPAGMTLALELPSVSVGFTANINATATEAK